jgi:hypothetical protein
VNIDLQTILPLLSPTDAQALIDSASRRCLIDGVEKISKFQLQTPTLPWSDSGDAAASVASVRRVFRAAIEEILADPSHPQHHAFKKEFLKYQIGGARWAPVAWKAAIIDEKLLLELNGTGVQTVFPPSVHPSEEPIRFDEDVEPADWGGSTHTGGGEPTGGGMFTRAVLVEQKFSPPLGFGPCRWFASWWVDGDETTEFMHAVLIVAKSEDTDLPLTAVQDTAKKWAEGATDTTGDQTWVSWLDSGSFHRLSEGNGRRLR